MTTEIRPIGDDELDRAHFLIAYSFSGDRTEEGRQNLRHVEGMGGAPLGLYEDGQMVACLRVLPLAMLVNGASIPLGGVSAVASLPEHRRKGYVGQLLNANMTMFLPGITRPRPSEGAAWNARAEAGANALSIATGHALDVFLWCLGEFADLTALVTTQVPRWQIANSDRTVDVTSPDTVAVIGRLTGGAVATVHVASIPWHGTAFRMEAYGTEGTLIASSNQMVEMVDPILRGAKRGEDLLQPLRPPEDLRWVPAAVPEGVAVNMAQMFRKFAEAIRAGADAPPDFAEAARRHHTLDAIARASGRRGWVSA